MALVRRTILERLFISAARREPGPEEALAITSALASSLTDLPQVYFDALEALAAQAESSRQLTSDEAAWSWLLDDVAGVVPGAELVWVESAMTLTIAHLPMSLTVEQGNSPSFRVGPPLAPLHRRLIDDPERRIVLVTSPEVEPLFASCEVNCVAGCCGTDAFQVATDLMESWLVRSGKEAGVAALRELDVVLLELVSARPAIVVSFRLNASWPDPAACTTYLSQWRDRLDEALSRTNLQ